MRMYDIIEKKREGQPLTREEINFFIEGYTNGEIPEYQASALCMAIFFQDMNDEERANITTAMVNSGETIDLSPIEGVKVDKHSTGGVGDTTTLILGPLVASLVPGFHVEIDKSQFIDLVNENKISVIGQTGNLTPADKKLYGLRDVTATVNSIPLIASSIMSKKIAAGADAIVLDVKTGAGAFMKSLEHSKALAEAMVAIGNKVGRNTMAVISDMNQPLGRSIGNALEVKEAIDTLNGEGPEDLTELCLTLGSQMVVLAGKAETLNEARGMLEENMTNGKALERFATFLSSQGGNGKVVEDPSLMPQASNKFELTAKKAGYVSDIVADEIGTAAMMLGAGRATKESQIDLAVGLYLNKKVGDYVDEGDSLLTIYANQENVDEVKEKLYENITVSDEKVEAPTLIHGHITGE